ncbi:MAG: hypothetical protein NVV63_12570 [Opitutus sp.]|nr:hypothetical protein [Opitutus sp.]
MSTAAPVIPKLTWRDLKKSEWVLHVLTKPNAEGKQTFSVQWRTDYTPGQPHSPSFRLMRGQMFYAVIAEWMKYYAKPGRKFRIHKLHT